MKRFDLKLEPYRDATGWAGFAVEYRVDLDAVADGDVLFTLPAVVASVPGSAYGISDMTVTDAAGALSLREEMGEASSMQTMRHFFADRATVGPVSVAFRAPVRDVDERTPVGPLFDVRREHLGLFGAGVSFLPLPVTEEEFFCSVTWILEEGVTAVSSHGTGNREWQGTTESLSRCLFGAGTPHSAPAKDADFGIHAYSEVPFDLDALADYLRAIHVEMSEFFEETRANYHVLVRRNPARGSGGTSFPSSFAFGYSPLEKPDERDLRLLLAHEMVHNWPTLSEGWEEAAWYSEGAAEFYSVVLPLRAGILPPADAAELLSEMYRRYDANPLRSLDIADAAEIFWSDLRAQTIPYGRGLQYLVLVDSQLREATADAVSLDTIVLDILRAQRRGESVGIEQWLDRLESALGPTCRGDYADMIAGRPLDRPTRALEGILLPTDARAVEHELGVDMQSFSQTPRILSGLIPGSAADQAGLRNGDELLTRRISYAAAKDGSTPLTISISRDGVERDVTYAPRGADVVTTDWVVKP